MTVLVAILSLGLLVLVHEAGHFLVARACRMRVEVFSVGFGPALLSYRGRQTEYRLSLVPLGGYVRIAGMAPGDFPPGDQASFAARPSWQRLLVLLAGPVVNWFFAFALLASLYAAGLRIETGEPVIEEVRGRAAHAAALVPGDRVLSVDGIGVGSWGDFSRLISARPAQSVELKVLRNEIELTLAARVGDDGRLGVTPESRVLRFPLERAIPMAFFKTVELFEGMVGQLKEMIVGEGEVQLVGPVGIVSETVQAARTGLQALVAIVVQISLALSLMNLLPLPALDGGRLIFVMVGLVRRRSVSVRAEAMVHATGLLALFGLLAWLSWSEIGHLLPFDAAESAAPDAGEEF